MTLIMSTPALAKEPHAAFADCAQFKERLAGAERSLNLPIPAIAFSPGGASDNRRHFTASLKSFDLELMCRPDGTLDSFAISQNGTDSYASARFVMLSIASIWSYTGWPKDRVTSAVSSLSDRLIAETEANRIRGTEFDNGDAFLDLAQNREIRVSGGKSFGLYLMIDASDAK
jgi:hypothetical protein